MKNPIPLLRVVGLLEAISFVLLVFVAMPLKYVWQQPLAVRYLGMAHGVLFVLFVLVLVRVMMVAKWPGSRGMLVLVASVLPFGPFVIDRRMKQWEAEFAARGAGTDEGLAQDSHA
jgi:integral membrane protein